MAGPLQESEVREVPPPPLDIERARRTPFAPYWILGVGRGVFSTSWTGRGTVRRRDARSRCRMFWTLLCCGSSTVFVWIALQVSASYWSRASRGRYCHDFHRSRSLSLFGRRSAFDITGLLAIAAPPLSFSICLILFSHTPGSHSLIRLNIYYPLFPPCLCVELFFV